MNYPFLPSLFHVDQLSLIMIGLVGFMAVVVGGFGARYLQGDSRYRAFFIQFCALIISLILMVSADHMVLFWGAWMASNALLVRLMIHKKTWAAALESGRLAWRNFALGGVFLAIGLGVFYAITHQSRISDVLSHDLTDPAVRLMVLLALSAFLLAAMTQSAIWPFHRWLLSSLNSPTPISAFMHAGLVNGGGFLLVRFAPFYLEFPASLTLIFTLGMVSVMLGTFWKLMQTDVKRMLACSTMGQMGFMLVQCGLGLFPAAVAHLCWHGMFKSYLFLASASAAQEKRLNLHYPPRMIEFCLAVLCGVVTGYAFDVMTPLNLSSSVDPIWNTHFALVALAGLAGAQFTLPILRKGLVKTMPLSIIISVVLAGLLGAFYGLSVHGFSMILSPLKIMQPQNLNLVHVMGLSVLFGAWLFVVLGRPFMVHFSSLQKNLYVQALNAAQPHRNTITAQRNAYSYKM